MRKDATARQLPVSEEQDGLNVGAANVGAVAAAQIAHISEILGAEAVLLLELVRDLQSATDEARTALVRLKGLVDETETIRIEESLAAIDRTGLSILTRSQKEDLLRQLLSGVELVVSDFCAQDLNGLADDPAAAARIDELLDASRASYVSEAQQRVHDRALGTPDRTAQTLASPEDDTGFLL